MSVEKKALPEARRRQSGITLIELIVAMAMIIILSIAVCSAFVAGIDMERTQARQQSQQQQVSAMERQITMMLEGAKMSDSATDQTTYFLSDTNDTSGDDLGTDRITFTTVAPGIPMLAQSSQDDFETQMQNQGPIGGVSEVSLGTTPVEDAGDHTGLFIRIQRPADEDSTQGGTESVLTPLVSRMGFQFWDGTQWVTSWDTTSTDSRRLPAAVQVSYVLANDQQQVVHVFIVRIPTSDVTPTNPIAAAAGT